MALQEGAKIVNRGPKDEENGATIFRFIRKGNRKDINIAVGQELTVGEDLNAEEGQQLLDSTSWTFEEVQQESKNEEQNGEGEA